MMLFIRSLQSKLNMIKRLIPVMLQESDLSENSGKREEYEIEKPG